MPEVTTREAAPRASAVEGLKPQALKAPEAPAPEGKAPEAEKLSPQFAALARKEKALRLEAQRIKLEREEVKAEKEKFKQSDYVPKERITKETLKVLAEAGLSHDQIANMLLASPQQEDPRIAKLESQIADLLGKTEKVETEFKSQQSKAYEQAVNQIRNDTKLLVDSDAAYETIKATGSIETVVEHIKQTFDKDGLLLSVEDAAKEVEELLVEEAIKLAGLSKVKSKLQPPVEEPKPQVPLKQQQPIRTLTHDLSASSNKQSLSAKDRIQRAVLRAQGLDPDTGKPLTA